MIAINDNKDKPITEERIREIAREEILEALFGISTDVLKKNYEKLKISPNILKKH